MGTVSRVSSAGKPAIDVAAAVVGAAELKVALAELGAALPELADATEEAEIDTDMAVAFPDAVDVIPPDVILPDDAETTAEEEAEAEAGAEAEAEAEAEIEIETVESGIVMIEETTAVELRVWAKTSDVDAAASSSKSERRLVSLMVVVRVQDQTESE
jgi:hypothetical protein